MPSQKGRTMAKSIEKEILKVALYDGLNEPDKLLWIKLWLLFGDEEVQTTRQELAELVNEKLFAFLMRYKNLRWVGAIKTKKLRGDGPGVKGSVLQVVHPKHWVK